MTWGAAWILWLLPGLAALLALRLYWGWRVRRRQGRIGALDAQLTSSHHPGRNLARILLLWAGLALLVIALAQPRGGMALATRIGRGANLVFAVDCSRSMQANDLYPTRMQAARNKARELLRLAPEHRVALMPFAGRSILRCPLTGDHQALCQLLEECSPDLFPVEYDLQGTAIGDTVQTAVTLLAEHSDRGQAIVIFSDGADPDQEAVKKASDMARFANIPIYGLFLGDPDRETKLEIDGRPEVMKPEPKTLEDLATATEAICVHASTDHADVQALFEHIDRHLAKREWREQQQSVAQEQYRWPLGLGLILILCGCWLGTRRPEERS